jgi:uncharacterized protein
MTGAYRSLGSLVLGGLMMLTTLSGAKSDDADFAKATFARALVSAAPSHDLGNAASTYAWLIGIWDVELIDFLGDGSQRRQQGEWYFSWTLEGRAVQDVLIAPRASERSDTGSRLGNRYGTTIRVYDVNDKVWRITFINPVTGSHDELTGRKIDGDVVQEGERPSGQRIRWVFTHIRPNACLWYGEALQADGRTWKREAEFHLRRRTAE